MLLLLSKIEYMKYIGYINASQNIEQYESHIEALQALQCVAVYVDEPHANSRERWKSFIDDLEDGDVAVLYSFDNAFRNIHDMVFFLKFCSKKNVQILSLEDELDTHDILFSVPKTKNILELVCKMFSKRDQNSHDDIEAQLYSNKYSDKRLKRYKMVINMYNAGYSVKEIMERTGYRGKSNIYRILHLYDVRLEYPSMSRGKSGNDIAV